MTNPRSKRRTRFQFSLRTLLLAVLLVSLAMSWLVTGGIAIQDVDRFSASSDPDLQHDERFHAWLDGRVFHIDVPLLFWLYRSKSPFRLTLTYQNYAEKTYHTLRLDSVRVICTDADPIELVKEGEPILLKVHTKSYPAWSGKLVHTVVVHSAQHEFPQEFEIAFRAGKRVACKIDGALIGEGTTQSVDLELDLEGYNVDYSVTYWEQLSRI